MAFAAFAIVLVIGTLFYGVSTDLTEDFYGQWITNTTTSPANQTTTTSSTLTLSGQFLEQSTLIAYNTSGGEVIQAANYTTTRGTGGGGSFRHATTTYNGTNITLDYDYLNTTVPASAAAMRNATIGQSNITTYLPTLGLLGAVLAIIALITAAFMFGRRS